MADETRDDDQVRRDELNAANEGDAIERRAIGSPATIRNRRAQVPEGTKFAETRGIYRDLDGGRRVVGVGSPIPDGWERIESATVADRVGTVRTAQDEEDTSAGGGDDEGSSAKRKPRSRSAS